MKTHVYTSQLNGAASADAPVFTPRPLSDEVYGSSEHARRPAGRGRHRKPQLTRKIRSEHGKRLTSFGLIGFGVFAAGLVVQVVLVQFLGVPKVEAYVTQLVLSVQANFLANYRWTWGDREAPFWRSCWRYNIKRLAGTILNLFLYPILVSFGMNYLIANAVLVIALTPVNYVLGHFWTFAPTRKDRTRKTVS